VKKAREAIAVSSVSGRERTINIPLSALTVFALASVAVLLPMRALRINDDEE
jgi:hypothetical protein